MLTGLIIVKNNRIITINYDGLTSKLLSFVFPPDLRPIRKVTFYAFRGVYPSPSNIPISGIQLTLDIDGTIKVNRNVSNAGNTDVSYYIDNLTLTYIA